MRRFAMGAVAFLGLTGSAVAADIRPAQPMFMPAVAPVAQGWSGFYIGANGGGGMGTGASAFAVGALPFATVSNSLSGALGGVHGGYNWQSGAVVYGIEADFEFTGIAGRVDTPTCPAAICGAATSANYGQKMPWFGTVRGRIGYASAGWLAYVTGGYAYGQLDTTASATAGAVTATFSGNETRNGWAVGGGVEFALTANWSARFEYQHLDFGGGTTNLTFAGLPTFADSARLTMEIVRAGVSYRF